MGPLWQFRQLFVFCFLFCFQQVVVSGPDWSCEILCNTWMFDDMYQIRYQIYDRYLMLFTIISYHSHVFLPSILRIQRDVSKKSRHLGRAFDGMDAFPGQDAAVVKTGDLQACKELKKHHAAMHVVVFCSLLIFASHVGMSKQSDMFWNKLGCLGYNVDAFVVFCCFPQHWC